MFITDALVAGGVAYAGVKTLVQSRTQATAQPAAQVIVNAGPQSKGLGVTTTQAVPLLRMSDDLTLAERRQLALAATAFWLSVGGWLFPPLTLASIPLIVYATVPILEAAGKALYDEGRVKPSVFSSILLVRTLVTDHYTAAAAISWLHHSFRQLGRRVQLVSEQITNEGGQELGDRVRQVLGGAPREVWVVNRAPDSKPDSQTVEVKIPFADLKVGDTLVVNRSEFIAVDGVITAGEATLNLLLLTHTPTPVKVGVGDRVHTAAFVLEGRIQVQVETIRVQATATSREDQ